MLEVEDARVEAGERLLVRKGTFAIERGQRVALIGPNGTGKTSLVESLLGVRRIAGGKVRMGHNVTASYFSQHEEELPSNSTVLEAMAAGTPLNQNQARNLLGKFLFSGDTVERKVAVLSGGERRRLSLARLVASGANFLVLDEPTNHLDVESREALEDAIEAYDGTVLFVSHDRALIDAVATHTLALEDQTLTLRIGDYNDYMAAKDQAAAPPPPPPKQAKAAAPKPAPAASQAAKAEPAPREPHAAAGAPQARRPREPGRRPRGRDRAARVRARRSRDHRRLRAARDRRREASRRTGGARVALSRVGVGGAVRGGLSRYTRLRCSGPWIEFRNSSPG